MIPGSKSGRWLRLTCILISIPVLGSGGADGVAPKITKAYLQEVYNVHVARDGLLLASVLETIKQNNIAEGAILTGIGSLQECAYHRSKSLGPDNGDEGYKVSGAMELLNLDGVIHGGKPHLHITFSNEKGAFGGHLEECRVLRGVDLVVAKFSSEAK
jgi:predicted DNA-binding protein with PD1-like motif